VNGYHPAMQPLALTLTTPDTIVLIACGVLGLRGAFKGFVWQLVRTLGLVGALWAAGSFYQPVGKLLDSALAIMPAAAAPLVGWVLIVLATFVVFAYLAHLARGLIRSAELSAPDRLLGFALGAVMGLALCAVAIVVWGHVAGEEELKDTMRGSVSARYMAKLVEVVDPVFPDSVRERFAKALKALDEIGELPAVVPHAGDAGDDAR
jgi:uncharacterized membrane protein required for colicin V production